METLKGYVAGKFSNFGRRVFGEQPAERRCAVVRPFVQTISTPTDECCKTRGVEKSGSDTEVKVLQSVKCEDQQFESEVCWNEEIIKGDENESSESEEYFTGSEDDNEDNVRMEAFISCDVPESNDQHSKVDATADEHPLPAVGEITLHKEAEHNASMEGTSYAENHQRYTNDVINEHPITEAGGTCSYNEVVDEKCGTIETNRVGVSYEYLNEDIASSERLVIMEEDIRDYGNAENGKNALLKVDDSAKEQGKKKDGTAISHMPPTGLSSLLINNGAVQRKNRDILYLEADCVSFSEDPSQTSPTFISSENSGNNNLKANLRVGNYAAENKLPGVQHNLQRVMSTDHVGNETLQSTSNRINSTGPSRSEKITSDPVRNESPQSTSNGKDSENASLEDSPRDDNDSTNINPEMLSNSPEKATSESARNEILQSALNDNDAEISGEKVTMNDENESRTELFSSLLEIKSSDSKRNETLHLSSNVPTNGRDVRNEDDEKTKVTPKPLERFPKESSADPDVNETTKPTLDDNTSEVSMDLKNESEEIKDVFSIIAKELSILAKEISSVTNLIEIGQSASNGTDSEKESAIADDFKKPKATNDNSELHSSSANNASNYITVNKTPHSASEGTDSEERSPESYSMDDENSAREYNPSALSSSTNETSGFFAESENEVASSPSVTSEKEQISQHLSEVDYSYCGQKCDAEFLTCDKEEIETSLQQFSKLMESKFEKENGLKVVVTHSERNFVLAKSISRGLRKAKNFRAVAQCEIEAEMKLHPLDQNNPLDWANIIVPLITDEFLSEMNDVSAFGERSVESMNIRYQCLTNRGRFIDNACLNLYLVPVAVKGTNRSYRNNPELKSAIEISEEGLKDAIHIIAKYIEEKWKINEFFRSTCVNH